MKWLKMLDPKSFLEGSIIGDKWYLSLLVSTTAYTLYFVQVFFDLSQSYATEFSLQMFLMIFSGTLFGSLGILMIAGVSWRMSRFFGGKMTLDKMIGSFALGYSPALIFMVLGLGFNWLLGWNTSLSFGIAGVLWAFMPMTLAIRKAVKNQTIPTVVIATISGILITAGFSLIHRL